MKMIEKLKNKRVLMALAGLAGLSALFVVPVSEANVSVRVHPGAHGPSHMISHRVIAHRGYYHRRHVNVRRWCHVNRWGYRHCHVRRQVWFN